MALKSLVEAECGGSNPLMQWSSNLIQGQPGGRGMLHHDKLAELSHHGIKEEDEMVREFLQGDRPGPMVPQTFNMSSLLQEIPVVPQTKQPHPHQEIAVNSWIEEFGKTSDVNQQHVVRGEDHKWVEEFSGQVEKYEASVQHWIEEFSDRDSQTLDAEKWVQEFQSENHLTDNKDGVSKVAREISSTVTDPKIQESEFMKFINKLGNGDIKLETNNEIGRKAVGFEEVYHYDNVCNYHLLQTTDMPPEWDKEFLDGLGRGQKEEDFWSQLDDTWASLRTDQSSTHPWLKDYEKDQEYKFIEDNPMKAVENPLEKGLEKLQIGDIPSAVLFFEAEVQQHPNSIEGWRYLGTSQAHNEQDIAAVAALEKCLQLDPGNLAALQGLAVSYTNESLQSKACQVLRKWLQLNPKYSKLVPEIPQAPEKPFMHSFMSREEHKEVTDLYLQAVRESVNDIDPDVQIGLGVLFNLSCDYDKAVDCFSAALQVRPDDAMLWNKLGATQANSNRSEEAIHAYRRALELAPGLTRSRYNLGISCINLRAYREAIEHFLMALNLQRNAEAPQGMKTLMSQGIWSTLRLAAVYDNRHDLLPLVDTKNLDELMEKFGM